MGTKSAVIITILVVLVLLMAFLLLKDSVTITIGGEGVDEPEEVAQQTVDETTASPATTFATTATAPLATTIATTTTAPPTTTTATTTTTFTGFTYNPDLSFTYTGIWPTTTTTAFTGFTYNPDITGITGITWWP